MRCSDERCTGNHNDRKYATLCPRSRENKNRVRREERARYPERHQDYQRRRQGTAAYMLSQIRYDASRRGGRTRATTLTD